MTCRTESSQVWVHEYNAENRISVVHKMDGTDCTSQGSATHTWTYTYDGDGVRVKEVYDIGGTPQYTKHYFAGGIYEVEVNHLPEPDVPTTKRYYSISGMMVAMHDGTDIVYFANDHLSSTSIVMNTSGGLESQNRYLPFGQVRDNISDAPIDETDFGYTGQRNLEDIGLMDYNARFYSPTLGRFLQPDTIIPEPSNPQAWNRYSYAYNNPIKFNDPSGHCPAVLKTICDWIEEKTQSITNWWNEVVYGHCAMSIDTQCGALGTSFSPPSTSEAVDDIVTGYVNNSAGGITQEEVDTINDVIDLTERLTKLINIYGEWVVNSQDEPYPLYLDPRTGEPIPAPPNDLELVDEEDRVTWDLSDREEYITEWHDLGYERPPGGWEKYDIHHIIPKQYGGTNDFWNLVPVERTFHQTQFNRWWSHY